MDEIIADAVAYVQGLAPADFDGRDPRRYRSSYPALLQLFQNLDLDDGLAVRAAALTVYGWMPTIMRSVDLDAVRRIRPVLDRLRREGVDAVADYLANSSPQGRRHLLTFVNNSVVGTSKFLHFLNPNGFAIWDSKIASLFGIQSLSGINSTRNYSNYISAIANRLKDPIDWSPAYLEFIDQPMMVGPVRRLECALFLHAGAA